MVGFGFGMVLFGMVGFGMVGFGMVGFGMVGFGRLGFGFGMACQDISSQPAVSPALWFRD